MTDLQKKLRAAGKPSRRNLVPPEKRNRLNYTGVKVQGKRFAANIRINNKTVYLGVFNTVEEAGQAYQDAVKAIEQGEPVKTNNAWNKEIPAAKHPLYMTWRTMKRRCEEKNSPHYPNYGGRGITYDPRWKNFYNFISDMGPRPTPTHSIDRIDNDKGYSKENCRWATKREQVMNRKISFVCKRGHERTEENTFRPKSGGHRSCRVCKEARQTLRKVLEAK